MDGVTSTSSVSAPKEGSNHDEIFMHQTLLFSDTLKDLKNLRKQLYSAAEYFEISYMEEDQKQIVVETLKDYVVKALINTVDHLGSVAYKVNSVLDEKIGEVYGTEHRLCCMEQRVQTCQDFINRGGLSQQLLLIQTPRHHKRYIFPVGETKDAFGQAKEKYHCSRLSAEENRHQFKNAVRATTRETPSPYVRERCYTLHSPQFSARQGNFLFTRNSINQRPEKQATSLHRFPPMCSGSVHKRSTSPNHCNDKRRYPSEPRRTVSLSTLAETGRTKYFDEQYSSKSKHLLKALLSMGKSRKDGAFYKFLDEY